MRGLEERLRRLLDEREIHDVLMRFCRGVDRCDAALIESCFHADAHDDHGSWTARGSNVAQRIVNSVRPGATTAMHFVGNVLIEVEGEVAFAESYMLAFRSFDREDRQYTGTRAARFVDRFERRADAWRISERVVVDDWNREDEVVSMQDGWERFRFGSKDVHDPVYAIRRGPIARSAVGEQP